MAFSNPDFTKINLSDAPAQDEQQWKAAFEKAAGAEYDSLIERTMEHIPVKLI